MGAWQDCTIAWPTLQKLVTISPAPRATPRFAKSRSLPSSICLARKQVEASQKTAVVKTWQLCRHGTPMANRPGPDLSLAAGCVMFSFTPVIHPSDLAADFNGSSIFEAASAVKSQPKQPVVAASACGSFQVTCTDLMAALSQTHVWSSSPEESQKQLQGAGSQHAGTPTASSRSGMEKPLRMVPHWGPLQFKTELHAPPPPDDMI